MVIFFDGLLKVFPKRHTPDRKFIIKILHRVKIVIQGGQQWKVWEVYSTAYIFVNKFFKNQSVH